MYKFTMVSGIDDCTVVYIYIYIYILSLKLCTCMYAAGQFGMNQVFSYQISEYIHWYYLSMSIGVGVQAACI